MGLEWTVRDVVVFGMILGTCLTLVLTGHASADSVIALIVGTVMKAPFDFASKSKSGE